MASREDEIINSLGVARALSHRYSKLFDFVEYQELFDIAEMTVIEVYDRWQSDKCKFSSFAWICVERELKRYCKKKQRRLAVEHPLPLPEEDVVCSNINVEKEVEAKILLQQTIAVAATLNVVKRRIVAALINGASTAAGLGKILHMQERTALRHRETTIAALKQAVGY